MPAVEGQQGPLALSPLPVGGVMVAQSVEGRNGSRLCRCRPALHQDQPPNNPGAIEPMETEHSFSLSYSEIGERLCRCAGDGVITPEQAIAIGNYLFPVAEPEELSVSSASCLEILA